MCATKDVQDKRSNNNIIPPARTETDSNNGHNFERIFKVLFGYEFENFKSITNFTNWLHRPVDGAALGIFRMFYGKYFQKHNTNNYVEDLKWLQG